MQALLSLYGWTARQAVVRALRTWPVALSTLVYLGLMLIATWLVTPLGATAGGFVLGFVEALCISSYLSLVGRAVRSEPLRLADLRDSFLAHLWDVVGVLFFLWIAGTAVHFLAQALDDHAAFLLAAWALAIAVFLNPVPEQIYQGRSPGQTTALLLESARFIQKHWAEWFVPNLLFGLALLTLAYGQDAFRVETLTLTLPSLFSLQGVYGLASSLIRTSSYDDFWRGPVILALVHLAMVFRGLLFQELATGSWRVRAFRSRTR